MTALAAALAVAAPGLDPAGARLLGEGLWGLVVDLGDGTIVKLVRQRGGLGEAVELWANEIAALRALEGHDLPFAVPRLVAAAELDEASLGFRACLRLTRLVGKALDDDSLAAMARQPRGRFACQLGEALAALHGLDHAVFGDPRAAQDRGHLAQIATDVADVAGPKVIAAIADSLAAIELDDATVANHGDVNSTNILVDDAGALVGLVDWAEARHDWREAEFCHLVLMPELCPMVRRAYEAAAGVDLDDRRLDLVGLHNALVGLSICRRIGEAEEAAWNLGHARRLMAKLGLH